MRRMTVKPDNPSSTVLRRRRGIAPVDTPPPKKGPGRVVEIGEGEAVSEILKKARRQPRRPRQGTHIHVSDLISRCIRKKALVELNDIPPVIESLSLMEVLTFAQGDAIHDVIKERVTVGGPSNVYGKWRCKCGSLRVEEPCVAENVDYSVECSNCGLPANVYEEISVIDDELDIVGHPDLVLYLPAFLAFYVAELKSISAKLFADLVRPQPDHVIQVLFYWFLLRRAGYDVADKVSILYVTKGYEFRQSPYKEFVINPLEHLHRLDPYLDDARSLLAARKTGQLPPRTQCVSPDAPDARSCHAAGYCFRESTNAKAVTVRFADIARSSAKKAARR